MRGDEAMMIMVLGGVVGVVGSMIFRKFILTDQTPNASAPLENGHKTLLERIQNVVGLVSQVDANPDNAQYKDQLFKQIREFKTDLVDNGLTVVIDPDENHKGFLQVVSGQAGSDREIARPLILRGEKVVLPGIELVASQ